MGLFRRTKPLHQRLAEAGGLVGGPGASGTGADPPGWDGEQRGAAGIHGVPRARRWDAVATAEVAGLLGDAVRFVALADGSLLAEGDEPDDALSKLAAAVEERIAPPYRADAVRRGRETWAVAASHIDVAEIGGVTGEEAELVSTPDGRQLRLDGLPSFGSIPQLEALGKRVGEDYVVRARRLDGDLWEVEASPL